METKKEFIKYCVVGICNTIVGITTALICLNILLLPYNYSAAMAYITGIIVSFILNKKYTFKDIERNYSIQFSKFVLTMLPGYIISYYLGWKTAKFISGLVSLNFINHKITNLLNISTNQLYDNIAVLISMTLYVILGFVINKFYVFRQKNKPQS